MVVARVSERHCVLGGFEGEGAGTGFMGATKSTCIALLRWPSPFSPVPTKTVQCRLKIEGEGRATRYKIQLLRASPSLLLLLPHQGV